MKFKLPAPSLTSPCVPARITRLVAELLTTVMVGVPVVTASVSVALPELVWRYQPLLTVVASPNFKLPMVRAVSLVTKRVPVMSTVLKSASESVPSATVPLAHLVVSLQAPLASAVHVPLWAHAVSAAVSKVKQKSAARRRRTVNGRDVVGAVFFIRIGLGWTLK